MKSNGLLPTDENLDLCKGGCIGCGKQCPFKATCVRHNTEPLELQRWFLHPPYDKKTNKCEYYKEIGTWTPEHEKFQEKMVARETMLQEAWKLAIKQALDTGVKGKEFPEFWAPKRQAVLDEIAEKYK